MSSWVSSQNLGREYSPCTPSSYIPCYASECFNFNLPAYEDVPEIDATVATTTNQRSFSLTEDQRNAIRNEKAGQLYAYRFSNTTVVLGTRNAAILGANIGISSHGGGQYKCVAVNLYSMTASELTINVPTSKCIESHTIATAVPQTYVNYFHLLIGSH